MTPRVFVTLLLAGACLGTLAHAQPAPKFEVATIKPSDPNAQGEFVRIPSPGRITVTNMSLLKLIRFAYAEGLGTDLEITGGPNWLDKDRFDVEAKGRRSHDCGAFFRPPGMVLEGASMAVLAEMLSTPPPNLGRLVVDRTGLSGEFNLQLEFQFLPPNLNGQVLPDDPLAPSLFTALPEQLGLKLQSSRGNTDVLVVDQAEKPTAN